MPDTGVFRFVIELIIHIFGVMPPEWLVKLLAGAILFGLVIWGLQLVAPPVIGFWKEVVRPFRYTAEEKRRRLRRQRFADHVESEIRRINNLEAWSDSRFAELEAEVETEGRVLFGLGFIFPFLQRSRLRKARSLTTALKNSAERLILLEGEPGSGKSVALRHVAQNIASHTEKAKNLQSIIPIYINLKDLRRNGSARIDRQFIEDFIVSSLNRVRDRDVEEFLEDEFRIGLRDGTWLFLFDSFDEIPDVLSSTDADETIRIYAEAIQDFLHGFNQCRGVVASREYKGPRFLGWPKFKILALSTFRRKELVQRTGLPINIQNSVIQGIAFSSQEFQKICSNPMFLNILCEYINNNNPKEFPEHIHQVIEDYIQKRLSRDSERVQNRFDLTVSNVKSAAEKLAFCMTADQSLGLNPTKKSLRAACERIGLSLGDNFEVLTFALEYLKLARSEKADKNDIEERFSFSHRRFQEYFASSIVIKEPTKISSDELLLNYQWRETAVALLQSKSRDECEFLLTTIVDLIDRWVEEFNIPESINKSETDKPHKTNWFPTLSWQAWFEPLSSTKVRLDSVVAQSKIIVDKDTSTTKSPIYKEKEISWPSKLLHVLGILQDGLRGRLHYLPETSSVKISTLLSYVVSEGSILDQKWALEVSGATSGDSQEKLLLAGFISFSNWVKDVAYQQASRLGALSENVKKHIRYSLITIYSRGELYRQRHDVYVQLSRLNSRNLENTAFLLAWLPLFDVSLFIISVVFVGLVDRSFASNQLFYIFILLTGLKVFSLRPMIRTDENEFVRIMNRIFLRPGFTQGVKLGMLISLILLYVLIISIVYTFSTETQYFYLILAAINTWPVLALVHVVSSEKWSSPFWWPFYFLYPFAAVFLYTLGTFAVFVLIVAMLIFWSIYLLPRLHLYLIAIYHLLPRWLFSARRDLAILSLSAGAIYIYIVVMNKYATLTTRVTVTIIISILLVGIIVFLVNYYKNYKRYKFWVKNRAKLNFEMFIKELSQFTITSVALSYVKDVRENQSIKISSAELTMMKSLIVFISSINKSLFPRQPSRKEYLKSLDSQLFDIVYSEGHELPFETINNIEIFDELCKLFEQLQTYN